jgi:hypothetical protein
MSKGPDLAVRPDAELDEARRYWAGVAGRLGAPGEAGVPGVVEAPELGIAPEPWVVVVLPVVLTSRPPLPS